LLVVATADGVRVLTREGDSFEEVGRGLEGRRITSVTASKYAILAGTADGVFVSQDEGMSWQDANEGVTHPHIRWLAYHLNDPWLVFAGTEPAAIFVSEDGAKTWRECPEVAALRDAHGWYLPYSPEAGCVRGFAFHGSRGYAAVEQGGLLRTDDGGRSWRLAGGSTGDPYATVLGARIHSDVHSVTVHPSSPDLVFAPTGGGLYVSEDGGESFTELYDCYCRAVWVDADDPAHLIFGPADGVDSNGRIEETTDGGEAWKDASEGLQVPWPRHMVGRFAQMGDELMAVLSNGEAVAAPLETLRWRRVLEHQEGIAALSVLET
jgi:hypothetical protein